MDQLLRRGRRQGGTVLREARETENVGIIARLADPYGAAFTIIELANEID
jgi:predicted enzyme related to lactoylglutathione lyase